MCASLTMYLLNIAASSGPPQNVTGTAVSTTLISLQWSLPAAIDINGIITKYAVNVEEVYTGQTYNLLTENMHINIGPLHPYYIYECSVAAYTIANGVFSSPLNVTTHETSKLWFKESLKVNSLNCVIIICRSNRSPTQPERR